MEGGGEVRGWGGESGRRGGLVILSVFGLGLKGGWALGEHCIFDTQGWQAAISRRFIILKWHCVGFMSGTFSAAAAGGGEKEVFIRGKS